MAIQEKDRDKHGRFLPGCKGGPGRPSRTSEEAYTYTLVGEMSCEDFAEIVRKAIDQAKTGDRHARRFLAEYGLGSPAKREILRATLGDNKGSELL